MDDDDEGLARLGAAAVFLAAGACALLVAYLWTIMESHQHWSDPQARTWTMFAGANSIAAVLAGVAGRSWPARFAGFLLLAAGAVAGGLVARPLARSRAR